ncbi:MAG: hypothetical protein P4L92_22555 [Rudaea sp.]|nr:hypothetical protein [Rudaea sp.]
MGKSAWFVPILIVLAQLVQAQSTTPHPRLMLDAATLGALRSRAAANTPQWQQLKSYCDSFIGGTVNYPDQDNYPDTPDIGQGYEGDGYWAPLMSEALCYQTLKSTDPTTAAGYGAKAADIAVKLSMPFPGTHGEDPCTDDGYVMRFFGVGMGILYDWAYDVLTPAQRVQIYTTANAWQTSWEAPGGCSSFAYEHPPLGNYFAGYFHAKTVMALATAGDNIGAAPNAATEWIDWQTTEFNTAPSNPPHIGVQPYYVAHMSGGGWPEGFGNYGPLATLNMSLPAWEVKTATNTDIVNAAAPYAFPIDAADYLMHFTWPSRNYIDDRDTNHSNGDAGAPPPGSADPGMFMQVLGSLRYWSAAHADAFQEYTNEVIAAAGSDADAWEAFLFYDAKGTAAPLATLPLSYFASGPNAVAARSDWTTNASWMSFRAGPYIDNPEAGEEGFDQGSLALVRGGTPLLVNGTGWEVHEPGGDADENRVYNDEYGGFDGSVYSGNRTIYNIFYVRNMNGAAVANSYGQESNTAEDDGVQTRIAAFEDGSSYVYTLATRLEDMYRLDPSQHAQVAAWSREIVYLRPNRLVVHDRTAAGNTTGTNTNDDQFLAFHFPANPAPATAPAGEQRYDVTYAANYAGAMTTVLPANAATTIIGMYPANDGDAGSNPVKVWQVQVRAPNTNATQEWLTVFDLSASASAVATASAITVTSGSAVGSVLATSDANQAILFNSGAAGTTISGSIGYSVPKVATTHFITELPPNSGYSAAATIDGSNHDITVTPGGSLTTSASGVLTFTVSAAGVVGPGDRIFADGFGG